jgi:hypothetical protein
VRKVGVSRSLTMKWLHTIAQGFSPGLCGRSTALKVAAEWCDVESRLDVMNVVRAWDGCPCWNKRPYSVATFLLRPAHAGNYGGQVRAVFCVGRTQG